MEEFNPKDRVTLIDHSITSYSGTGQPRDFIYTISKVEETGEKISKLKYMASKNVSVPGAVELQVIHTG